LRESGALSKKDENLVKVVACSDISTHGETCFLLDEDRARVMAHDEDRLRLDIKKLLGQAFALTCLADVKAGDWKKTEDKKAQQIVELQQEVERLRTEVAEVGLELANKTRGRMQKNS